MSLQKNDLSPSLNLSPPEGKTLSKKWSMFVMLGEPGWPRRHVEALAAGAIGTSKTSAMVAWLILRALSYPGIRLALARDTLNNLYRSVVQTIFERSNYTIADDANSFDKNIHIGYLNKREDKIIFANESTIWLFGLNDHRAIDRLVGTEWGGVAIDQLERVREDVYASFITRLRQKVYHKDTGEIAFPMLKATANLDKTRRSWVFRRFFDGSSPMASGEIAEDVREKYVETNVAGTIVGTWRAYFAFKFGENESINPYYAQVLAAAGDGVSGFLADEWDNSLEEIYANEFDIDEGTYRGELEFNNKPLVIGLDFGVDSPTVAIFGIYDPDDGVVYIDREYDATNLDASLYATSIGMMIFDYIRRGVNSVHIYADPNIWNRTGTGETVADKMMQKIGEIVPKGVFLTFQPAYHKGRVKLKDPNTFLPVKEALRRKKVKINKLEANKTIEMLRTITWKDAERDIHPLTDYSDAFRYLITNVPSASFLKPERDDEEEVSAPTKRVISWGYKR